MRPIRAVELAAAQQWVCCALGAFYDRDDGQTIFALHQARKCLEKEGRAFGLISEHIKMLALGRVHGVMGLCAIAHQLNVEFSEAIAGELESVAELID